MGATRGAETESFGRCRRRKGRTWSRLVGNAGMHHIVLQMLSWIHIVDGYNTLSKNCFKNFKKKRSAIFLYYTILILEFITLDHCLSSWPMKSRLSLVFLTFPRNGQ